MSRKLLPKNMKKIKIGISLNPFLIEKMNKFLEKNKLFNRSKYIENLIIKNLNENNDDVL